MAEVFLALQVGAGGFEKVVVLKRIFDRLCEDASFVDMFLDEARLAASIHHPNVVEILDIALEQGRYAIAMEYLAGIDLGWVCDSLAARRERVPVGLALSIAARAGAGLHAAHTALDKHGRPRAIVHRDVTPSNVIACFNGAVKLVDFGIAKAVASRAVTEPGQLKGKLSYLAPEQICDEPTTTRSDVYQLGVMAYELVTGTRLFRGGGDRAIMEQILAAKVPAPSVLRSEIPEAVDAAVMRAMAREPSARHHSADELVQELEHLVRLVPEAPPLGRWLSERFAGRRAELESLERACRAERPPANAERLQAAFAATAVFAVEDSAAVSASPDHPVCLEPDAGVAVTHPGREPAPRSAVARLQAAPLGALALPSGAQARTVRRARARRTSVSTPRAARSRRRRGATIALLAGIATVAATAGVIVVEPPGSTAPPVTQAPVANVSPPAFAPSLARAAAAGEPRMPSDHRPVLRGGTEEPSIEPNAGPRGSARQTVEPYGVPPAAPRRERQHTARRGTHRFARAVVPLPPGEGRAAARITPEPDAFAETRAQPAAQGDGAQPGHDAGPEPGEAAAVTAANAPRGDATDREARVAPARIRVPPTDNRDPWGGGG